MGFPQSHRTGRLRVTAAVSVLSWVIPGEPHTAAKARCSRSRLLLQGTSGITFLSIGGDKLIGCLQLIAFLEHGLEKRLILLWTQLKAFRRHPAQGQGELAEVLREQGADAPAPVSETPSSA